MTHERFDDLAPVYALGALDGEEMAEFERHLAGGCERCRVVLDETQEVFGAIARGRERLSPPAGIREGLMERVGAASRQRLSIERHRPWRWAIATAAAVVAAAALTGAYVAGRYEARLGIMARDTARGRERLRAQEGALEQQLAVVDLLRDPATRVIALHGSGPSPNAAGRVVWHPSAGGRVVVANLPSAPSGKTYELWTIAGGTPRPAGVFTVDASGRAIARVAPTGGPVDVFAVTLEPDGGVPAPSGPIVLASAR